MNIIEIIEQKYPTLSRQERKVALQVLQHPSEVKKLNIISLAKKSTVSTATVTRFVKKMDCNDFNELKLELAALNSEPKDVISNSPLPDQVTNFYNQMITGTWKRTTAKTLSKAIALIRNASNIFIFGLGSSGYTAKELSQRLLRMGFNASAPGDSHTMFISSSIMNKNDLVIVLSVSGESSEINEAVNLAKPNGVSIISITAFEKSTLASMSDLNLFIQYSNFVDDTRFINSQLSMVYIIDVISTMLLQSPVLSERYQQTVEAILSRKLK